MTFHQDTRPPAPVASDQPKKESGQEKTKEKDTFTQVIEKALSSDRIDIDMAKEFMQDLGPKIPADFYAVVATSPRNKTLEQWWGVRSKLPMRILKAARTRKFPDRESRMMLFLEAERAIAEPPKPPVNIAATISISGKVDFGIVKPHRCDFHINLNKISAQTVARRISESELDTVSIADIHEMLTSCFCRSDEADISDVLLNLDSDEWKIRSRAFRPNLGGLRRLHISPPIPEEWLDLVREEYDNYTGIELNIIA